MFVGWGGIQTALIVLCVSKELSCSAAMAACILLVVGNFSSEF